MGRELIPRSTIEEVVGHRNRAVQLYVEAFDAIERAAKAVAAAEAAVRDACGGTLPEVYVDRHTSEVEAFRSAVQLPNADQYRRVARRLTDIRVWGSLVERTDLEHLMDKEAKDQLRSQMAYVPEKHDRDGQLINADEIARGLPEVSVEAVRATLEGFAADSGQIWRRGIANAFANLDRRFRSHDGFKVGSRIILSHAFDSWGSWNYYRNHRDTLLDIERVFLVLDGKGPRAAYAGIVGKVDAERRAGGLDPRQTEHEGDYFRIRIFKNGNAHLWFTRKDLVAKVNRILAEHYGAAVADGVDTPAAEVDPLEQRAVTPARDYGFYPTPQAVVDRIMDVVPWSEKPLRVLEPSAGTGNLVRPLVELGHSVTAVETQWNLAMALQAEGICSSVYAFDFVADMTPDRLGLFDLVVMNPPFDRERDVDHVSHAWKFLKPGGTLIAIMSAGTEFRETRKSRAFRELMEGCGARWHDLPMGAFAEVGTNVSTCYVVARKPA